MRTCQALYRCDCFDGFVGWQTVLRFALLLGRRLGSFVDRQVPVAMFLLVALEIGVLQSNANCSIGHRLSSPLRGLTLI